MRREHRMLCRQAYVLKEFLVICMAENILESNIRDEKGAKKFLSSNIWIKDEESKLWTLTFTRSTKRICAIERACPYDNKWAAILKLIRKPKPTRNADEIGDTWDEDWCKYYVEVLIRAATNHLWRLLEDSWRKRDLTVAAQWEMLLLRSEIA